jgi:DMSO/TMAO reductase YedYZ molybdopterin-dependent catalytic subunit
MKASGKPGILTGAVTGAMLTAVLIAIFFAAWRVAGLPFVPFDVFDWVSRVLPGRLIGFGISTMVAVIRALHVGPTSVVAKGVEQAMGIAGLFFTGIVGGAVLFSIMRVVHGRYAYLLGLLMGIVVGIPVMLISLYVGHTATVTQPAGALWIMAVFFVWGAAFGWAYRRLSIGQKMVASDVESAVEAPVSVERLDRRRFLVRLGGTTAVITVAGAMVGVLVQGRRNRQSVSVGELRWSAIHPLPNAGAAVKPAPGTRPEFTPLQDHYRIDINTVPPHVDGQQWRLKVGGLVAKPLTLTLNDLRGYEPMHQFITLSCISNPVGGDLIGTTRWTGVSLQRLLPELGLKAQATHLKIFSVDGFYEVVPLEIIRSDERFMLTYAWDGVPLPTKHGFPLRIYVPDVYGMKQPKWIESIEATDHWEPGYWVARGWNKVARMKATSVIDTVAADAAITGVDGQKLVPIGGIAHAGARGISKVELQLDNGPWRQAELRTPLSDLTWVIWRYNWPFESGEHIFTVRCWDGADTPQIVATSPPDPSGATGLYSTRQKL